MSEAKLKLESAPEYDPLLECLVIFAKQFHRPISVDALISGLPVKPGEAGPEMFSVKSSKGLFSRVAKRAGFSAKLIKRDLADLSDLLLPCILVLQNRNACVLESIDYEKGQARVILPEVGDGEEWIDLERLQQEHTGFAFLLKREFQQRSLPLRLINARKSHWFWGTLAHSKEIFVSVLLASVLANLFIVATPLFTMNVYDRVVPNDALDTLWVLAIGISIIYIFDALMRFIRSYLLEVAGKKSDIIMSSILFEQVLNLRMDQWPKSVGAFANNLRDFESIRSFFTASTIATLVDLPFAFIFLLIIWYIAGPMVIIPLVIIATLLIYSAILVKPLRDSIESTFEASANKNAHLIESLHSIQTIKTLGASHHSQWVWEEATGQIAAKSMRARLLSGSITVVTNLLVQINTVGLIIFGVYQIGDAQLSLGGLIATVMLSSRAVSPMGQIAGLITNFQQTRTAYNALDGLMNSAVERPENKKFVRRPAFEGGVEFQHVNFYYPEAQRASLSDISLKIKPKEHIGVIGRVGSGKTSITKLMVGLYAPTEGSISIDGIDINQIDPADLRHHIGYLSQDVELMRGTIRDNLAFKDLHINDDRLLEVAAISGVDQFVNKLPMGFDTPVGEQGTWLSGGQRQSIALGRALLLDEPILILDEPTNSMDNTTETAIRKRLFDYTRDKTLILVTHKAPMLALVERLVVIEDGRIVMDGPKEKVLEALKGGQSEL
ncbi:MAG: type I secretion system permease/ATPase [Gammaproteobacteria bacterium]|nr:MAG: type I secretion system permease/ATPase [Gammaproteobacteria bacterium]